MVLVETPYEATVYRDEPDKAGHAVEDAAQAALLARHAGQLAVGAVEQVGHHEHGNGDKVHHKASDSLIIEAAAGEEHSAGGANNHGEDGHRIWMYIKFGEKHREVVAQWPDEMVVKPVLRLGGFKGFVYLLVHINIQPIIGIRAQRYEKAR